MNVKLVVTDALIYHSVQYHIAGDGWLASIGTTRMNQLWSHAQTGVSFGLIEDKNMRTGRSISMDSKVWTEVGLITESEYEGDVSAAIEQLCTEALKHRGVEI